MIQRILNKLGYESPEDKMMLLIMIVVLAIMPWVLFAVVGYQLDLVFVAGAIVIYSIAVITLHSMLSREGYKNLSVKNVLYLIGMVGCVAVVPVAVMLLLAMDLSTKVIVGAVVVSLTELFFSWEKKVLRPSIVFVILKKVENLVVVLGLLGYSVLVAKMIEWVKSMVQGVQSTSYQFPVEWYWGLVGVLAISVWIKVNQIIISKKSG